MWLFVAVSGKFHVRNTAMAITDPALYQFDTIEEAEDKVHYLNGGSSARIETATVAMMVKAELFEANKNARHTAFMTQQALCHQEEMAGKTELAEKARHSGYIRAEDLELEEDHVEEIG